MLDIADLRLSPSVPADLLRTLTTGEPIPQLV